MRPDSYWPKRTSVRLGKLKPEEVIMNEKKMSQYPEWDAERYPYTCDYILQLFNAGFEPPDVYRAVARCFLLNNKAERQALANKIAVLHTCDVMAEMPIPADEAR